ncbi:MAG: electron transport complex subunit RsxG [Candidatus Accumulibacter sp. UW26]|jgi:electron transport complex protein RnfG
MKRLLASVRDRLAYQALSLGVIALLAASALVLAVGVTRDRIAAAEALDLQTSLLQVLPENFADNDLLADALEIGAVEGKKKRIYLARRQGAVTAAIFETAARGYAGDIVVLIAVDPHGMLLGARVLKHTETPGLGDKIELARSPWILSFNGLSLATLAPAKWAVKKDGGVFDQMAGATITPRAVVKAVKDGLDFFAAQRAQILQEGKGS